MQEAGPGFGWRVQFAALSAIWGSSFLFIKVLGRHWPALWIAFGRVALGALTLVLLSTWRGESLRFERSLWLHLVVASLLFNVIPFTLFALGEKHVSSIVAGLWNATTPLWVLVILLLAFAEERPGVGRVVGIGIGFVGVALLLGPWRGLAGAQLQGQLECAGAALCYGLGFPYTRRYLAARTESGVVLSAGQLLCASGLLAIGAAISGLPTARIGVGGVGSIIGLGMFGSGVAYALNYSIVRAAGSAVASTVTYLIPVFSTLLGVVLLSEPLSWNQPVGTAVLLGGVAAAQGLLPVRSRGPVRPAFRRRAQR
jgi:drug/metabolite transporter (DMT)-like permease